jgi:ATPase family AAA domain-containing protein 3A/B
MFGGRKNSKRDESSSLSKAMTPENPPKKSGGGGGLTGFDPEGLERAAKAARELDGSRNAPAAIELIKTQEVTKQVRRKIGKKKKKRYCIHSLTFLSFLYIM